MLLRWRRSVIASPACGQVLYASGPVDPDTDGDGMPDDWERTHGLVVGIDDSELDLQHSS